MESVDKNKNGDSVPRKINVNFSKTEEEFNSPEKTLEDIIDEELAFDGDSEPVIEEKVDDFKRKPIDFQVNESAIESNKYGDSGQELTLDLDMSHDDIEETPEPDAKILTMEEDVSENRKETKNGQTKPKKKSGKGLIGFLLGVIFATVILFALFYMMSMQIIPNSFFPGKTVEPEKPVEQPVSSNTGSKLDLAFLKMNNAGQNMIYSPLSIKYALSMLSEGANGNTKDEIDNVLGDLNLTKYENIPEVLSLANSVFVRDGFVVKEEFKSTVAEKYASEVLNDPFENAANINNWAANKTFNLIQNAVPDEAITPETMMALVNALAIQMDWEVGFDTDNTSGNDFTKADGSIVLATTMHSVSSGGDLRYAVTDDATIVAKDLKKYGETQLEFIAIMPDEELGKYVANLSNEEVDFLLSNAESVDGETVKLSIPKFKFDYNLLNFGDNLVELGIKDAFGQNSADFSKMADGELHVSRAIHKANIDFSEDGIKAAAVTVFIMDKNLAQMVPKFVEVKIDRPFFFEIRDKENGEVWFTGTVYEPNLWENDKAAYMGEVVEADDF